MLLMGHSSGMPSHGFRATWHSLVDGCALTSSNDTDYCAATHTGDNQKSTSTQSALKEKLTAWSLKVAEYEHQFQVMDDAENDVCREGDDADGHQASVL